MAGSEHFHEAAERIYLTLRSGGNRKDAYTRAGVASSTFFNWCKMGKAGKQPYADFVDQMKIIEIEVKLVMLGFIMKAAKEGKWTAAAWVLERRYPEEFGKLDEEKIIRQLLEKVTVVERSVAEIMVKYIPQEKRREVAQQVAEVFRQINQ